MLPLSGKRPCSCIRRVWFFDSCCSCSALSLDRSLSSSLDRLLKLLNMLFDALVFLEEGGDACGDAGSAGSEVRPIPPSMEERSMPSRAIGLLMGRSRGACRSSTAVRLMVSSLGLPCRGIMVRRSAAREAMCCMGGSMDLDPWDSATGVWTSEGLCFKRWLQARMRGGTNKWNATACMRATAVSQPNERLFVVVGGCRSRAVASTLPWCRANARVRREPVSSQACWPD